MNGPQWTAVSRIELWQKWKLTEQLTGSMPIGIKWVFIAHQNCNQQLLWVCYSYIHWAPIERLSVFIVGFFSFIDTLGWPTAGCRFPDWIGDVNWIDLSGKHYYILHNKNSTITVDYKRQANAKPHTKYAFRCVSLRNYDNARKEYTYITHASREW